eukprot:SAG11_NODE_22665_length_402_cov_0.867987_1_plen_33_part_01
MLEFTSNVLLDKHRIRVILALLISTIKTWYLSC